MLFDSGVGGLSVLAELRRVLPGAPVIYAADIAGLPYGTKSEAEIAARVAGMLGRIAERYHPRLACIACNTASTIALDMVREVLEIPIVGTVPAIKPAAALTRSGVIGLLGTQATMRQSYVDRLEAQFAQNSTLLRHGASGLVALAEAKMRGEEICLEAIRKEVQGLVQQPRGQDIDVVVLACTHFPLLQGELQEAFGTGVQLVHGAQGIATRIASLLDGQELERDGGDRAVTTGDLDDFRALAPAFNALGIDHLDRF